MPDTTPEALLEKAVADLVADGWSSHGIHRGVYVLSHNGVDPRIRTARALVLMEVSAERIRDVIADFESYPGFVPYVAECAVLNREENRQWVFQQLDLPWPVRNRYFTVRITRTSPEGGGHHRFEWTLSKDPAWQRKGYGIGLPLTDGSWEIIQPGPEPLTLVTYEIHADPGGWIPAWAILAGHRIVIPKVVNALRDRAKAEAGHVP